MLLCCCFLSSFPFSPILPTSISLSDCSVPSWSFHSHQPWSPPFSHLRGSRCYLQSKVYCRESSTAQLNNSPAEVDRACYTSYHPVNVCSRLYIVNSPSEIHWPLVSTFVLNQICHIFNHTSELICNSISHPFKFIFFTKCRFMKTCVLYLIPSFSLSFSLTPSLSKDNKVKSWGSVGPSAASGCCCGYLVEERYEPGLSVFFSLRIWDVIYQWIHANVCDCLDYMCKLPSLSLCML